MLTLRYMMTLLKRALYVRHLSLKKDSGICVQASIAADSRPLQFLVETSAGRRSAICRADRPALGAARYSRRGPAKMFAGLVCNLLLCRAAMPPKHHQIGEVRRRVGLIASRRPTTLARSANIVASVHAVHGADRIPS